MRKILTLIASSVLGIALVGAYPLASSGQPGGPPPPPKKKRGGPTGDLRKAYDLLRRVRSDNRATGRPEERLRDWTDRAVKLYRDGVKAFQDGDPRLAHEYGAAAHDLARTVDHARNAALYEGPDRDLPPPPDGGPEGDDGRTRDDLRRAYDRIQQGREAGPGRDSRYYLDAARDLYNAARRDAVAGRSERAGELARAAEAITHVPEHLSHAVDARDDGPPPPDRKGQRAEAKKGPREFDVRPEPKKKGDEAKRPPRSDFDKPERKGDRLTDELPPPLDDR